MECMNEWIGLAREGLIAGFLMFVCWGFYRLMRDL
jgi:hypothetical protein